jgi:CzcA family heavy metal efflux pump
MLTAIVRAALARPGLVLVSAALLVAYGVAVLGRAEYEVFPEFVPPQATIQVEAPGFVAEQVEALVTRPIEDAVRGANGVEVVRSESAQGLAVINVTFREGEDPYRARQVVAERLAEVSGNLPAGVDAPALTPLTSSTMDLLKIGFTSDSLDPLALRDLVEWTVRPRLLAVPGVARATVYGGAERRYEVRARDPDLVAHNVTLADVADAVDSAARVRGGGYVDTPSQRVLVEPRTMAVTAADIAAAPVVQATSNSAAVLDVADVADVVEAPGPKFGDALIMGKPGVLLSLSSQYGANTLATTRAVESALEDLSATIESQGATIWPRLHRPANFIETALAGIRLDLWIGGALITIVLLTFTGDLRIAVTAFVSIPLSLLAALIVLDRSGSTINTMTLGGLAVALGVVIDDAVIGIENMLRRLRESPTRPTAQVLLDASVEVRAPVVYATFVLALAVTPVLFMTGLQGAFFAPLALAFLLATIASLAVAITVTPAMTLLMLRDAVPPTEPRLLRRIRVVHSRWLVPLCDRPRLAAAAIALLGLVTILGFWSFGGELLPAFRERHYVLQLNGPSGASLDWMRDVGARVTSELLAIPGVATVEQQIGRAEAGEDPFPPSRCELHVELEDVDGAAEERILGAIRAVLARYPEVGSEALTFLGDRIGESLSGETAALAIGIYGADLDTLDQIAARVAQSVKQVPGAVDVRVKTPPGAPSLVIEPDPQRMARRGVSALEVNDAIAYAFQGTVLTQVKRGERTIDVALTDPGGDLRDPESAGEVIVRGANGALIPLAQVARLFLADRRASITHDGGRRRQVVTANATTSDVAGWVARIRTAVERDVALPRGVYLDYQGAAQGEAAASRQLLENVLFASVGIVMLLGLAFGGWRPATLILAAAPCALAGGVATVALGGGVLSLGGLVGFVALFGITSRNAILLLAHSDHLVAREDCSWNRDTIVRATSERVAPILMTAVVTGLGMAPLALGSGEAGREVQGPMAAVILGGLVTSMLLSLFLLPPLILAYRHAPGRSNERIASADGL